MHNSVLTDAVTESITLMSMIAPLAWIDHQETQRRQPVKERDSDVRICAY